jgi:hypothetical protein
MPSLVLNLANLEEEEILATFKSIILNIVRRVKY